MAAEFFPIPLDKMFCRHNVVRLKPRHDSVFFGWGEGSGRVCLIGEGSRTTATTVRTFASVVRFAAAFQQSARLQQGVRTTDLRLSQDKCNV